MSDDGKLTVSVDQAARMCGVARSTMYEAIRQNQIPHIKLGARRIVIPRATLERLLGGAGQGQGSEK